MNSLNSILLEGTLIEDPDESSTDNDAMVCSFSIMANRSYKKEKDLIQEESYFPIEVYSNIAEACLKHLHKGRGVRVVGRLKQDRWLDENENQLSQIKIIAEHVEFKPIVVPGDQVLDKAV
ncbi:MAG: single-stranded DNA-binding protein [Spirochaetaceae bacterium]